MHVVRNRVVPLVLVALPLLTAMAGSRPRPWYDSPGPVPPPAGLWKGVSVCLQGKPVCKDEVVVYHIAMVPTRPSHFLIMANKLVNGREEGMGVLDCRFSASSASLECPIPADKRPGIWRFRVQDRMLDGELVLRDGAAFRHVHVVRVHEATASGDD